MHTHRLPPLLVCALVASGCGGKVLVEGGLGADAANAGPDRDDGQTGNDASTSSTDGSSSGNSSSGSLGNSSSSGTSVGKQGTCSVICTGCCDANGVCNPGGLDTACGSGGASCTDCTESRRRCINDICGIAF